MPALCLARLTGTKLTSICTVPLCLGSLLVQVPLFWGLWAPGGAREHLGLLQLILTELSVVGSFLRPLVPTHCAHSATHTRREMASQSSRG